MRVDYSLATRSASDGIGAIDPALCQRRRSPGRTPHSTKGDQPARGGPRRRDPAHASRHRKKNTEKDGPRPSRARDVGRRRADARLFIWRNREDDARVLRRVRQGRVPREALLNKSANVKLKALVVIRHVAEKGARSSSSRWLEGYRIKDCHVLGPADPLRGDEPYRKVRVAAGTPSRPCRATTTSSPPRACRGFPVVVMLAMMARRTTPAAGPMEGFGNYRVWPTTYMAKAQRMASQMAEKAASRLQKSDSYRGGDQRRSAEFSSHIVVGRRKPAFWGRAERAAFLERARPGGRQAADSVRRCGSGPRPRSFDPSYSPPNRGANAYGGGTPGAFFLIARTGATGGAGMWAAAGGARTRPSRLQGRARRPTKRSRDNSIVGGGPRGGAATDGEYERLGEGLCAARAARAPRRRPTSSSLRGRRGDARRRRRRAGATRGADDAKPWQSRAKACAAEACAAPDAASTTSTSPRSPTTSRGWRRRRI